MKLPAISIPVKGSETHARGLLLSCLQSLMKAHKQNSVAPLNHFLRERLTKKNDRALLNVMLNAIVNQLARGDSNFKARGERIMDSAGSGVEADVAAMKEEIETHRLTISTLISVLEDKNILDGPSDLPGESESSN